METVEAVRCDVCGALHEKNDEKSYFEPTGTSIYEVVCKSESCVRRWAEKVSGVNLSTVEINKPNQDYIPAIWTNDFATTDPLLEQQVNEVENEQRYTT